MTRRLRNPLRRRHRDSTTSEPPETPPDAYTELLMRELKYLWFTPPSPPNPFLSALSAIEAETEPPARYTAEQLASKLYSPQGEPITEVEYHQIVHAASKYQRGTWVATDGHGGTITTDYHGGDNRDRPTTPLPWWTNVSQQHGTEKFRCGWPDEETAVRGHHILIKEMTDAGAVEFMQIARMEMLCKAVIEPDRPF